MEVVAALALGEFIHVHVAIRIAWKCEAATPVEEAGEAEFVADLASPGCR